MRKVFEILPLLGLAALILLAIRMAFKAGVDFGSWGVVRF